MPSLEAAINELKSALATAQASVGSAAASTSLDAARQERDGVIRDLETAVLRAEGQKLALDDLDEVAREVAAAYHGAVADVRDRLSGPNAIDPLIDAEKAALRAAFGEADDAEESAWLDPLRTAIDAVDTAVDEPVATATAALQSAIDEYETARQSNVQRKEVLEGVRLMMNALAPEAGRRLQSVFQHLHEAQTARTAGQLNIATVSLDSALDALQALKSDISLDPGALAFDADNGNAAAVEAAVRDKWITAKVAYQNTLATLVEKEAELLSARLTLALRKMGSAAKQASRDVDAAAAVETALSP